MPGDKGRRKWRKPKPQIFKLLKSFLDFSASKSTPRKMGQIIFLCVCVYV